MGWAASVPAGCGQGSGVQGRDVSKGESRQGRVGADAQGVARAWPARPPGRQAGGTQQAERAAAHAGPQPLQTPRADGQPGSGRRAAGGQAGATLTRHKHVPLQAVEAVAKHVRGGGAQAAKGGPQRAALRGEAGVRRGLLLGKEKGGAGVLDAGGRLAQARRQLAHVRHAGQQLGGAAGLEDHAVCMGRGGGGGRE